MFCPEGSFQRLTLIAQRPKAQSSRVYVPTRHDRYDFDIKMASDRSAYVTHMYISFTEIKSQLYTRSESRHLVCRLVTIELLYVDVGMRLEQMCLDISVD